MLLFWSHSRILVVVPNKIVKVVENADRVAVRENVIELAKVGEVKRKTVIIDKLSVVD